MTDSGLEVDIAGDDGMMHRTGRCCFVCCDYRRGVWILDVVLLVLGFVGLIYTAAVEEHWLDVGSGTSNGDPQNVQPYLDAYAESSAITFTLVGQSLETFLFLPLAIYGALKFRWSLLLPECLWKVFGTIIGLLVQSNFCREFKASDEGSQADSFDCAAKPFAYVFDFLVVGLILYPHVVFIRQCRNGLMAPETYETKEKSCCCC